MGRAGARSRGKRRSCLSCHDAGGNGRSSGGIAIAADDLENSFDGLPWDVVAEVNAAFREEAVG